MPAPTNPKKRSLMPSGALRRALRAAGHHLSTIVQVGKGGATDAVARQLEQALYDHELVKVRVGAESPEDRFEAAERLATAAGAQLAQIIGRTLLVYKRHPEKPRFEPRAAGAEAPVREARSARAPPRALAQRPGRRGGGAGGRGAREDDARRSSRPSGGARPRPKPSGRAAPRPSPRGRPKPSGRPRPKASGRTRQKR